MIGKIWNEIKSNHIAQMAVCCLLPVVLILGLQLLGFAGFWIFGLAIAVCIGSHLAMTYFASKNGSEKACH